MTFSRQKSPGYIEESELGQRSPSNACRKHKLQIYGASKMGVEAGVECGVIHEGGNQLVAEVVVVHAQRSATEKHAGAKYKVTPSI